MINGIFSSGGRKSAVFLTVLLSSFLLSGCLVRFMYDWLDVYAAWKIDDYFDITRSQKSSLYSELDRIIAWHRRSELAKYSAYLREISAAAEKPLSEAQVRDFLDRAYEMSRDLLRHSAPSMNRLAARLSDEQIKSYLADRTRHQQNDRDDFMKDHGVKAHRKFKKQLVSSLEYALGSIEPSQQHYVDTLAGWYVIIYPKWLDYEELWVNELVRTFGERGKPAFEKDIILLFLNAPELGGGRYSEFIRMYNDKLVRWISDFSARLTPEQREHFRERLDDLADELDSIGR